MSFIDAFAGVDLSADAKWKVTADTIIYNLARTRRVFTSDDVWEGLALSGVTTHENRAMGPRITNAVKNGYIAYQSCDHCHTNKVVIQSRREESHNKHTTVYESLIYGTLFA